MAELLLLGMTHYPPLAAKDDDMAGLLRGMLKDPGIPARPGTDHFPTHFNFFIPPHVQASLHGVEMCWR